MRRLEKRICCCLNNEDFFSQFERRMDHFPRILRINEMMVEKFHHACAHFSPLVGKNASFLKAPTTVKEWQYLSFLSTPSKENEPIPRYHWDKCRVRLMSNGNFWFVGCEYWCAIAFGSRTLNFPTPSLRDINLYFSFQRRLLKFQLLIQNTSFYGFPFIYVLSNKSEYINALDIPIFYSEHSYIFVGWLIFTLGIRFR